MAAKMDLDQFDRLIATFSPDKPFNLLVAGITFAIGYVQYVYAISLMLRERRSPMPYWMHCFYLAHDSSWSYLCGKAAPLYDNHWLLRAISTALGIWATLEVFCIYKTITVEREEVFGRMFGKDASLRQILAYTALLQAAMYCVVLMFIDFVGQDRWDGIFQWFAYTNVLIIVGPTNLWLERGSRHGLAMGLAVTNVLCAVFTFTPWSMWVAALPEVFDNRVYYTTGLVMFLYSIYMCWVVGRYPEKRAGKTGQAPIW